MLRWRILIGAALIALIVGLFWLDAMHYGGTRPATWVFPLLLLVAGLGSNDLSYLYAARGWKPSPWLLLCGNLAIVGINLVPVMMLPAGHRAAVPWAWPVVTFLLLILTAFIVEMRRYEKPGEAVLNIALLIFGWCYVGLLLTTLVELRVGQATSALGVLAVATMILFVKLGDIGGYTLGRLFGRHKMTPTLSPGKTWEGAFGAALFVVLGALAVEQWWLPELGDMSSAHDWNCPMESLFLRLPTNVRWMIYGIAIAGVGLAGDLAESLIKRDLGRKDSSSWLPGFGGTLDVLDSILFAAPVAYVVWAAGWLP